MHFFREKCLLVPSFKKKKGKVESRLFKIKLIFTNLKISRSLFILILHPNIFLEIPFFVGS